MQLRQLKLTHVRIFEQAEFEFHPGMNLLVGINGAGKSTVLDALNIMLSQVLPKFTASRSQPVPFEESDIMAGRGALTAELCFKAADISFEHLMHLPREQHIVDKHKEGKVREQTYSLSTRNDLKPDIKDIPKNLKNSHEQPLAVYFSTHRSYPVDRKPSRQSSTGRQSAAFAEALKIRELNIREFSDWLLVQETLANEDADGPFTHRLTALSNAVTNFLDDCSNLRAVREPQTTMLIDKSGVTLNIRQLSDGERSMLALVLDIARRLTQANPELKNPLQEGKAVVLIDELDLHLHPCWQRNIAAKLTATFPNCQFIAATHSPQVIGEVSPNSLIFLAKDSDRIIVRPGRQGYGLDTNWILEHLMDTPARNITAKKQIDFVEDALEEGDLDTARLELEQLRKILHGDDGEVARLEASINNLEELADEMD